MGPRDGTVGLVEGVDRAAWGDLHVGMREHKLADLGVECEDLDARAKGEAEKGRGGVEAIARADERVTRLEG